MKKNKKAILIVFGLIISVVAGYFGTDWAMKLLDPKNRLDSEIVDTLGTTDASTIESAGDTTVLQEVLPPVIKEVTIPVPSQDGKNYSFAVIAEGTSLKYGLADSDLTETGELNETGEFTVPATAAGVYFVYAIDIMKHKSEYFKVSGCTIQEIIDKITVGELTSILNSGDASKSVRANFKGRVYTSCQYIFEGLNADEDPPVTYLEIINRINMGTWSSVNVISISYTLEGRLSSAVIKVNY